MTNLGLIQYRFINDNNSNNNNNDNNDTKY